MSKGQVGTDGLVDGILGIAESFARPVTVEVARRLAEFAQLLLRWNARINLTGARNGDDLLREHFPDSFALASLVPPSATLVDVGSGGGLPALPFALLRPDVAVTLVEPRAKRVAFLRTAIREVPLAATVFCGRTEEVEGTYDVASSRATFAPGEWLREGRRLVRGGGEVVFLVHEDSELPFVPGADSRLLRYNAGAQSRVAAALRVISG